MKRIFSIAICLICVISFSNAQVVVNPIFDRSDVAAFRVQKVEITKDTTFVYCSYSAEAESWANISKGTYLYSTRDCKKYPLLKCVGLPYAPQQKTFWYDAHIDVLLCFPSVDRLSRFDIIENEGEKAFNIYGIDITRQNSASYRESELSHYANMSLFYDSSNDTLKAIQFMTKEIEAVKCIYGVKSETLMLSLINAGAIYSKYGYYDKSIDLYKKSIDIFESNHIVDNEYAIALRFAANDYYKIDDIENALLCQKKCIEARRIIGDFEEYCNELYVVSLTGEYKAITQRIDIVEQELKTLPPFAEENSNYFVEVYKKMASLYSAIKEYKYAIDYCDKAICIMKENAKEGSENYAELLALKCKYQTENEMTAEAILS